MDKVKIFVLLLALLGFYACQSKGGQMTVTQSAADNISVASASEKTVIGVVKDASMNSFMLVTKNNDTVYVSTMDQNPDSVGGFMLGDTVKVNYIEEEEEPGANMIPTAKQVMVIGKGNPLIQ